MPLNSKKPVLRPEDHEHFLEHGFVVVKNSIPPEIIAAAVKALERKSFEGTPGMVGYKPVQGSEVEACTTDKIHQAIAELLGTEYPFEPRRGGSDMPRLHQPDAEWHTPTAHVDDDYPIFMPDGWALGLFIFLTPVKTRGGAFIYFPGSYLRYQRLMSKTSQALKGYTAKVKYSGKFYEFLAEPGDALLFHHLRRIFALSPLGA